MRLRTDEKEPPRQPPIVTLEINGTRTMIAAIRRLIDQETKLSSPATEIAPQADLYAMGLDSFAAVRLLLAIEREFNVEIPRDLLKRETVRSIDAIVETVRALRPAFAEAWRNAA
ncbi:NADH dehydrogenase (ubiquinone) 1 alpha/beta subcomplex 1 [Methylocystis bryophila]